MWHSIKVRKDKIIVYLPRHDSLTKSVIEGDVEGYIGWGRPKMEYIKQIMVDMEKDNYKEFKEWIYKN